LTSVTFPESIQFILSPFVGCNSLTTVFYEGSSFPQWDGKSTLFDYAQGVKTICVPPDYNASGFCGKSVTRDAPLCQEYMKLFNNCYKGVYFNGEFIQQRRLNATQFESRTNKCVEYRCYNDSGPVAWSLCNSTDETNLICIEGECIKDKTTEVNTWTVEINMDANGVRPSELNTTELMLNISVISGISEEKLSLGFETDEKGYVVRILLYVKDEEEAKVVTKSLEEINIVKESCDYGVLCLRKSVKLRTEWTALSCGYHLLINQFFLMIILAMIMK